MRDGKATSDKEPKSAGWWRPVALIAVVVSIIVLSYLLGIGRQLEALRGWIEGFGPLAPLAFALVYIVAVVAALPGSAITVAAGALFGSIKGVILVSVSSTVGASIAFLVGRYFARKAVVRWLSGNEQFSKLDRLTEIHGAIIVAVTRLVPLFPFNLLNYGFGLTRIRFWTYVFWSWLCMLPGTVLYVVGADAVFQGISQGRVPWIPAAVVMAVFGFLVMVARRAKSRFRTE